MVTEPMNPNGAVRAKEVTAAIKSATAGAQPQGAIVRPVVHRGPARTPDDFRAPTPDNSNTPSSANDGAALPTPWLPNDLVPEFTRAPVLTDDTAAPGSGFEWIKLDQASGKFVVPRLGEEVPAGALFVAFKSDFDWADFSSGKPVRIPRDPTKPLPKRSELQPPKPTDGSLDPLVCTGWLFMLDLLSGDRYAFYTGARWGHGAIDTLMARAAREQHSAPGSCPIIRFESFQPDRGTYRSFWAPRFIVTAWKMPDGTERAA
jgi:hypothetical protein